MALAALTGPSLALASDGKPKGDKGDAPPSTNSKQKSADAKPKSMTGKRLSELPIPPKHDNSKVEPEYTQARELFWAGRYDDAAKLFRACLDKDPLNESCRFFLELTNKVRHRDPEREQLVMRALQKVRFHRIEWSDLPINDAINYLRESTRMQLDGGESVNFISALHGEKANQKISLAVADADLAEVIQQITTQAGIDHRIEPEGIIFENKIGSL